MCRPGTATTFDLLDSRVLSNGTILATYAPCVLDETAHRRHLPGATDAAGEPPQSLTRLRHEVIGAAPRIGAVEVGGRLHVVTGQGGVALQCDGQPGTPM